MSPNDPFPVRMSSIFHNIGYCHYSFSMACECWPVLLKRGISSQLMNCFSPPWHRSLPLNLSENANVLFWVLAACPIKLVITHCCRCYWESTSMDIWDFLCGVLKWKPLNLGTHGDVLPIPWLLQRVEVGLPYFVQDNQILQNGSPLDNHCKFLKIEHCNTLVLKHHAKILIRKITWDVKD